LNNQQVATVSYHPNLFAIKAEQTQKVKGFYNKLKYGDPEEY
jgi:hypothetical protein